MKEISLTKKYKVISLFFSGLTYDEIAVEVGIGKGSVVNIIDDFKAGKLPIMPNEYIDALRELAVDMRKQHINVKQLKMYDKIHQKLTEMGVSIKQVDDCLDISGYCHRERLRQAVCRGGFGSSRVEGRNRS